VPRPTGSTEPQKTGDAEADIAHVLDVGITGVDTSGTGDSRPRGKKPGAQKKSEKKK